jgi:hypothetical protein
MNGTGYFVSLQTGVVLTEEYNIIVNSEELIGITECVTVLEVTPRPISL